MLKFAFKAAACVVCAGATAVAAGEALHFLDYATGDYGSDVGLTHIFDMAMVGVCVLGSITGVAGTVFFGVNALNFD